MLRWLSLAFLILAPVTASAEPALVTAFGGQAFLFSHRGLCYAILPKHVHRLRNVMSLATAAPQQQGRATVFYSTDDCTDLSVASVEGPASASAVCGPEWSALPRSLQPQLAGNDRAEIVRLSETGLLERTPASIERVDHTHIEVTPLDERRQSEIAKGTSGALLVIDGAPAGLAVTSTGNDRARFLRMDEIVARLSRLIEGRAMLPSGAGQDTPSGGADGPHLPFQVVAWNVTPLEPELSPMNLANPTATRPFVAAANEVVILELELSEPDATALRQVTVTSRAGEETSPPKRITIEVDSSQGDRRRWRQFAAGEASPEGRFEAESGSGLFARRVRIKIHSLWFPHRPLQIDSLLLE